MEHQIIRNETSLIATLHDGENRLNRRTVEFLHESLNQAESDGLPWVLTADGKFFSTGLDLDFLGSVPPGQVTAFMDDLYAFLRRLLSLRVGSAVAINGHAFGAAAVIAVAADYRVMRADRGYFCFPEIDLGMSMTPEFEAVLNSKLDRVALHQALLTGTRYAGPEALARGLVDAVAEASEVLPLAAAWAARLSGKSPTAMALLRTNLHGPAIAALPEHRPAWPSSEAMAPG